MWERDHNDSGRRWEKWGRHPQVCISIEALPSPSYALSSLTAKWDYTRVPGTDFEDGVGECVQMIGRTAQHPHPPLILPTRGSPLGDQEGFS